MSDSGGNASKQPERDAFTAQRITGVTDASKHFALLQKTACRDIAINYGKFTFNAWLAILFRPKHDRRSALDYLLELLIVDIKRICSSGD